MAPAALKRLSNGPVPVLILLVLVLVTLHLMSSAVQNTEELSGLFVPLLFTATLGLLVLVILVGINLVQLVIRYRRQAAGSRLTLRMVAIFIVLSLVPVTVVYYYSQQFLMQGIDSWFDVQIDQAMEDALGLSRASLDLHKRERLKSTQRLIEELSGVSVAGLSLSLQDLRDKYEATELALLEPSGRPVAVSNIDPTVLVPDEPDSTILQQVRIGEDFVGLDPTSGEDSQLQVRVVVHDASRSILLQAIYPTSRNISHLTETVQNAYNRYKELAFLRKSLKQTFTLALALVLLFGLLSAIWAAFFSARRLVAPITDIAEGTRAVAKGDYDTQLPIPKTKDELGFLVSSFNAMMRRISQARDAAAESQRQVEAQRGYLETVLGSLSSGVMALDALGRVRTANQAALDILQVELSDYLERPLNDLAGAGPLLSQFIDSVRDAIGEQTTSWREELTLFTSDGRRVLLCRGTPLALPESKASGYVLVFDDITTLIQAQRNAAWGEVARRLAHEIKNPLTPIQLSAERLRHKYLNKMPPKDAEILDRATHTIVQQVEAMKTMVNAFSDYARPPKMNPEWLVLDDLVQEVLDLYRSAGHKSLFKSDLHSGTARIEADPVRMRQVIHNLLKNAQEAVSDLPKPRVEISTRLLESTDYRRLEFRVSDNGPGFDETTLSHLFEPYVTTKVKGTGLGMAIVKKIIEEHGGLVRAENRPEGGACITLRLPQKDSREAHSHNPTPTPARSKSL
ncbi:MAG: HAMP domain-containing protein [Gammaproteobacteria bacterium]|nr:HAMP domain-containing protein [Gammaproteobacteria bacterium]